MVAQHERASAAMITVDVPGHGVAVVDYEDADPNFEPVGWLRGSCPATRDALPGVIELRVEVLRRLGGLSPRALLGGVYVPQGVGAFVAEVAYSGSDATPGRWPSQLARRTFAAGLPSEFAGAVVDELAKSRHLPAGVLRIQHAGFDEVDSSSVTFRQAARLLGDLLPVTNGDVEITVREVLSHW